MAPIRSETADKQELQRRFNEAGYWQKVQRGEFYALVKRCKPKRPDKGPPDAPEGSVSQNVEYFNAAGERMAFVHQYVAPGGAILASGKPDPTYVYVDGVVYRLPKGYVS